jgi:hypothetical protein
MMNRREALRVLGAGASLELLGIITPDSLFALGQRVHRDHDHGPLPATRQNEIIGIAAERIIPAGDTPGATDANVGAFIDRILSGWYSTAERERMLAGLADLDSRSVAAHGRSFVQCSAEQQTALLAAFDDEVTALREARGRGDSGSANPDQHWFSMFKYLTVWGYFTSESAARETLRDFPLPGRYDGCAPYAPAVPGH